MPTRLLQLSDLHLSDGDDPAWRRALLEQIVTHAKGFGAAGILIPGHFFDPVASTTGAWRSEACSILARLGRPLVWCGGAGERGPVGKAFTRLAQGEVHRLPHTDVEVVALDTNDIDKNHIVESGLSSAPDGVWRVGMAHAAAPLHQEGARDAQGVLDPEALAGFHLDYLALGGSHAPSQWDVEGPVPWGSSGPGRRLADFPGPCRCLGIELGTSIRVRPLPLTVAGGVRALTLWLDESGEAPELPTFSGETRWDTLRLTVCGVAGEAEADERCQELLGELRGRFAEVVVQRKTTSASGLWHATALRWAMASGAGESVAREGRSC